jgi:adenosylcobinamide-phosphate synthase
MSQRALVLILAVALDWLLGEPQNAWHPVAWFGKFVQALERRAPHRSPRAELLYGAVIAGSGIAVAVLPALALERVLARRRMKGLKLVLTAALFKISFAWRYCSAW